ncbi:hypothetical protein D3C75_1077120 [compost metagenome]
MAPPPIPDTIHTIVKIFFSASRKPYNAGSITPISPELKPAEYASPFCFLLAFFMPIATIAPAIANEWPVIIGKMTS